MLSSFENSGPLSSGKDINTEMTMEEYKTGMFHASGIPKVATSSKTPQPTTQATSKISSVDTNLPTTSSNSPAVNEKVPDAVSITKPSNPGGNVPATETSPDYSRASQTASSLETAETGSQLTGSLQTSPQPVMQPKPATLPSSSIQLSSNTPENSTNKVIHIKHDKLKPLSKTLSALGQSLNEAHNNGELKEGSHALNNVIQSLLKTIGKLKSQVDSLRNDQVQLETNNLRSGNQAPETSSQSEGTSHSTSQSTSSMVTTSQSAHISEYARQPQSNTKAVDESHLNEGISNESVSKTNPGSHIPLKLRIIGKAENKEHKNATVINLKLSDQQKPVVNNSLTKTLVKNPTTDNTNTISSNIVSQNAAFAPDQTTSRKVPLKPSGLRNVDIPLSSDERSSATQNKNIGDASGTAENPNLTPTESQKTNLLEQAKLTPSYSQNILSHANTSLTKSSNLISGQKVIQPQSAAQDFMRGQQNTQNVGANGKTKPQTPINAVAVQTSLPSAGTPSLNQPQKAMNNDLGVSPPAVASPGNESKATAGVGNVHSTMTPQAATTLPSTLTKGSATFLEPKINFSAAMQVTPNPQTTSLQQQSVTSTQSAKPSPAKITKQISSLTQTGTTTSNAELPHPNTLPQDSHSGTIQPKVLAETFGQYSATKPSVTSSSLIRRPVRKKSKDFAVIESKLSRTRAIQKASEKSSIPG